MIHQSSRHLKSWQNTTQGRRKILKSRGAGRGTVSWIGFYADISKEWRCHSEIKIWAHFYNILVVFLIPWPTPSWFVPYKQFYQHVKFKKEAKFEYPLSNFGSFSYFQTSLSLGVEQGLQKLPKFDINDLRLLFRLAV